MSDFLLHLAAQALDRPHGMQLRVPSLFEPTTAEPWLELATGEPSPELEPAPVASFASPHAITAPAAERPAPTVRAPEPRNALRLQPTAATVPPPALLAAVSDGEVRAAEPQVRPDAGQTPPPTAATTAPAPSSEPARADAPEPSAAISVSQHAPTSPAPRLEPATPRAHRPAPPPKAAPTASAQTRPAAPPTTQAAPIVASAPPPAPQPQRATLAARPLAPAATESALQISISIGRIDVRMPPTAANPQARPRETLIMTLDDYMRRRRRSRET